MNYGQIFVTEEPRKSFLCIKERGRGRAEVQNVNAAVTPAFLGREMGKFKMGAGHRQAMGQVSLPAHSKHKYTFLYKGDKNRSCLSQ